LSFHKTGTKTLSAALSILGYEVCGVRTDLADTLFSKNFSPVWEIVDEYDAFQDNPWPILYKELDSRYPNSKFILTVRNEQKWIASVVNHFGENHTEMRRLIYGVGHPKGKEDIYLNKYLTHNQEVIKYFQDTKDRLLVVSWEKGDGWKELCGFLNCSIPNKTFPHINKGAYSSFGRIFKRLKICLTKSEMIQMIIRKLQKVN